MDNHDVMAVQTTFHVERWDADQVDWTLGRMGIPGRWHQQDNVTLSPGDFARHGVAPYKVTHDVNCNMLVQAGWVALLGGIAGTSVTNKFSATYGRIGVGTVSTAAAYSDTKLGGDTGSGSTTSYYMLCGAAPAIATASTPPTLTFTASFGTGVANFAWNEFGTDNYSASGATTQSLSNVIFVNHGISAQGTKLSGQIWAATEIMTFGVPTGSGTVG
jgi:hypothetical protein